MAILFPKDILEGLVSSRLFASDNYSVGGALLLKQVQFVGVRLNFVRLHADVLLSLSSRIFFGEQLRECCYGPSCSYYKERWLVHVVGILRYLQKTENVLSYGSQNATARKQFCTETNTSYT